MAELLGHVIHNIIMRHHIKKLKMYKVCSIGIEFNYYFYHVCYFLSFHSRKRGAMALNLVSVCVSVMLSIGLDIFNCMCCGVLYWPYSGFVETDTKERRWPHNTSDTGRIFTTIACDVLNARGAMTTTTATSRIGL